LTARTGTTIRPKPSTTRLEQVRLHPRTALVWPYRGHKRLARPCTGSRYRALHRLVIRSSTTLRRDPGDVPVRILDVAGFAMDTVLGVDLEARTSRLFHPFIDTGRAIAVRGTGK